MEMRLNSLWISRKKYVLAPLVLLVLLLAIAACGSDSSITQSDAAMEAERMEAEAMAMEEEKKEAEAMAMEEEKKEAEAMAMEEEKMEAEAMAMEEEKMEAGISLQLDLSGVDPLANGYHYEGWAIIGGDPVSTASSISGPTAPSSGWMERSKRMEFSIRYPRWERQPTL
jgi:hypothetical protein